MKTSIEVTSRETNSLNKWLKTIALSVLAILILWWFGRKLNWAEVRAGLAQADVGYLFVANLVVSVTYLLRSYRWRALLKPFAQAGIRDLFIANVVGFSAFFLAGRAGEVVRPALLPARDRKIRPASSFVTILVERICDFVAIVLLFAANLVWFPAPPGHDIDFSNVRKIGLILLLGTLVGLAILFWFARNADVVTKSLDRGDRFPGGRRVGQLLTSLLGQLAKALKVVACPRAFIIASLWTGLLWFAIIFSNLLIIRAFGVEFGFRETIFVVGWALVGSLVPTPGGAAGAFHAAAAAGLVFLGVKLELAAAIAILVHLIDFAPAVIFALYYLVRGEITFRRLRDIRPHEGNPVAVEAR